MSWDVSGAVKSDCGQLVAHFLNALHEHPNVRQAGMS